MKGSETKLVSYMQGSDKRFVIPVYQRNYDWKRMQCITLFRDIESIAIDENRNSHFGGTIVYVEGDSTMIEGKLR